MSLAEAVLLHLGTEGENVAVQEVFLKSSWFAFAGQKGERSRMGEKLWFRAETTVPVVAKGNKSMPGAGEGTSGG